MTEPKQNQNRTHCKPAARYHLVIDAFTTSAHTFTVWTAACTLRSKAFINRTELFENRTAGPKKSLKMESDDLAAGLDNLKFANYGDADDDLDFM